LARRLSIKCRFTSVEREDNDGPYCPENCLWATAIEQRRNRRDTKFIEAYGESKTAAQWTDDPRCPVGYLLILDRLQKGWDAEEAIITPKTHRFRGKHDRLKAAEQLSKP
jgi:hypothetical protein